MSEEVGTEMDSSTKMAQKSFFRINKNLVMLKLTLFFLYGATSSLIPYLTIHMQSIGLSMEQVGIIYLALPFTTFISPAATGYLMDKLGKYKPIVITSFLLTAVLHHSLLLFPEQEMPGTVPSGYIIRHPKKMYVEVWWSPCTSRECPAAEELDVVLDMCVDHCLLRDAKFLKNTNTKNLNMSTDDRDPGDTDDLSFHIKKKKTNDSAAAFTLDMHPNLGEPIEQFGIEIESAEEDEDVTEFKKRFRAGMLRKNGVDLIELESKDLRCGGIVLGVNHSTKALLKNYTSDCILQKCQFRSGGPSVCPPDYKQTDDKTFWLYFFLRFLGTMAQTAAVIIIDPVALAMIEKYGGDFGKERLFSSLGMAIFSPITGALIDWSSSGLDYTNYSWAFYVFDALLILASICLFFMKLDTKLPADDLFGDLINIFKKPPLVIFVLFLFILGNLWGFIESFLFFYLRHLGAPNYLLGITVTVGTLSSVPFLYGADNITRKIGHVNVIIIAFFAHAARLVGYSVIESAWWCFPFEALESLSVHLMWVAVATYCAALAPRGLLATLIGVCAMAHYSVGRGSGSFVGGHIIAKFGITMSFRLMGAVGTCAGLLYTFLHYTWLKNYRVKPEEDTLDEESLKLQNEEPKFKDQGTMVSMERLSLMVEFNQIGSITSLSRSVTLRNASIDIIRRSSLGPALKGYKSSNSKAELLKSALDINNKKHNSEKDGSNNKLYKSSSLTQPKLDFEPTVLCEKDEIVYDEIKKKTQRTEGNEIEEAKLNNHQEVKPEKITNILKDGGEDEVVQKEDKYSRNNIFES
ncbi:unnamed protein product [Phaedon cochleariae]|uniref:Major facilitator superfamily associated domain-containing protein n=1 Tax=Phaedon cochleariae TaxID=80249 RepID=A0A9P0DSH5_PHACE|nr:unnamed protein product [Phaedon cochleariae]